MPNLGDCNCQLGMPFQGDIWYFVQSDYCTAPCPTEQGLVISRKVIDARIGTGDRHEEIRGIHSACACNLHELAYDFTFHLEYHPQCSDSLLERVCDRVTDCTLPVLAFSLVTNQCVTITGNRSAFLITGCKPKTIRISASFNQLYTVAIDFSVQNIITDGGFATLYAELVAASDCASTDVGVSDTTGWGIEPTDGVYTAMGAYLGFNMGGSIYDGNAAGLACILNSFDVTIDHGLKDKWDHDSMYKQQCIEGTMGATGTCDISLNSGGDIHWADVMNQTAFDIIVDMGGSACPRLKFENCKWKSSEIDVNISGDDMMESAPWTCHPSDCSDGFVFTTP